jgi:uncharacterized protein with PIN domain
MSESPKYITDNTLAKLAKWLRLLGYDTAVFPRKAGREMLQLADAEQRIVLSRRQDLLERQFSGRLYLVQGNDVGSQLREVMADFSLTIEKKKMFQICLRCNEKLIPTAKEAVRDLVPPYVFENCDEYDGCPRCLSIYWAGTHQRNSLQFLEKLSIIPV